MKKLLIAEYQKKKFSDLRELPKFRPGDTVRVDYEIQEGGDKGKVRVQAFEGVVIRLKKGAVEGSFTVRKVGANSVGVERSFPLCSPSVKAVKVMVHGRVRRSRLFYLRERSGKSARIKSRYSARSASAK